MYSFTRYLKENDWTYPLLYKQTQIPVRTLYRWGRRESLPSIEEVAKIARAMRKPFREIAEALGVDCAGIPYDHISEENIEAILDLLSERMKAHASSLVREINS